MINTATFTERLLKVMNYYSLNASALADELGIQRSGISHLLSERNKPSLEFILKLNEKFPEVSIEWITMGKGIFPSTNNLENTNQLFEKQNIAKKEIDLFSYQNTEEKTNQKPIIVPEKVLEKTTKRQIKKIIFFYEDNSFEIFEN